MARVYLGLGSNLFDPKQQIISVIETLSSHKLMSLIQCSSLYFSRPMGPQDQPDYMNAVVEIDTQLSPIKLLDALQKIENDAGRVRQGERWGSRVLDIDILLFDNITLNSQRLTIPHYGLKQREFVLLPLAEIAPQLNLPNGESIIQLADKIDLNGLKIHSKLG